MVAKEDTLYRGGRREDTRAGPGPAFSGKLRLTAYWEITVNSVESLDWEPTPFLQQETVT